MAEPQGTQGTQGVRVQTDSYGTWLALQPGKSTLKKAGKSTESPYKITYSQLVASYPQLQLQVSS
jgi:hypothetical protein